MDSTISKDSREIKFTKFGQVDYFLCNLQDLDKICDLNLNFKSVWPRVWPWRGLTGWRGVLLVVDTDSVKEIEQGPLDHDLGARIRSSPWFSVSLAGKRLTSSVAARGWMAMEPRCFPEMIESMMMWGRERRWRLGVLRARWLPGLATRGGWRTFARRRDAGVRGFDDSLGETTR
jgi:hypothetical protein